MTMAMMEMTSDVTSSMNDDIASPRGLKLWLAWAVAGAGMIALALGLVLTIAAVAEASEPFETAPTALSVALMEGRAPPLVAIVIDDVGLNPAATRRVIALPASISLALLPYAVSAAEIDARARAAGHETLAHLPMEPMGLANPGPDALTTWMSASEVRARVDEALARLPGVAGLNNHMGSRFTRCGSCVAPVVAAARARGVYVLDSITTPHSRLGPTAQARGVRTLNRDVFLDNRQTVAAVLTQLREAEAIARRDGSAVAIGHPHAATLEALEIWIPQARARGVEVGAAGDVLARRGARGAPGRAPTDHHGLRLTLASFTE